MKAEMCVRAVVMTYPDFGVLILVPVPRMTTKPVNSREVYKYSHTMWCSSRLSSLLKAKGTSINRK